MGHPPIDQQITFLYTRDLAATAHFYEDLMGLALVLDQGTCRIYRVTAGSYIGFCQRDDAPSPDFNRSNRTVIFTLVTQDVDDWYRHLTSRGVPFEEPPTANPDYQIYHSFLRDPNGYLLEIQRFLNEDWNKP